MQNLVKQARIETGYSCTQFIHVTGSNGKGSVCAMLYSILRQAGFSVGVYTSPHLADWRERFLLDGKLISEKEFTRLLQKIKPYGLKSKASQFEILTAMALEWFAGKKPDFVVCEVGLGGRLDATNVVNAKYAAITSISLEHTRELGKTIGKIAWEKSKIIKPNAIVVTPNGGAALKVIEKECKAQNASLIRALKPNHIVCTQKGTTFILGSKKYKTSLLGFHQAENAANAIAIAKHMGISDNHIKRGLLNAKWPGRLQVFARKPLVVLDGAHNPAGIKVLVKSFAELFGTRPILVVGVLADKEWKKMARTLVSRLKPSLVIATEPDFERKLNAETLAKEFATLKAKVAVERNVKSAVQLAMEKSLETKKPVLVTGSLYVVGEALA